MKKALLLCAGLTMTFAYGFSQGIITIVFDGPLSGGVPKGVELYFPEDVADLSPLGIGSANNGDGTDSVEFSFPAVAVTGGTYLYVSSDSAGFADFFGFNTDYITGGMAINGDDAIELFWDGEVIDIFGEIDVDGSGTSWEYTDGWAARKPMTGPDGEVFELANWNFSGPDALDGETTNAGAVTPVPLESYTEPVNDPDVTVIMENLAFEPADITIEMGQTVRWTNVEVNVEHNVNGSKDVYPCNPVGFFSGPAALGVFDFDVQFTQAGFYEYQCDPHISSGMVGTVMVVDPNAPEYTAADIGSVTTVDEDGVAESIGEKVALTGVVIGPNFRPGGLQFTMVDDAGDGIGVFKGGEDCYEVTEGDKIVIEGEISQFSGLTQIGPETQIQVLEQGVDIDPAQLVLGALGEEHESQLIAIGPVSTDSIISTGASGWNVFASGGANSFVVRLDSDVFDDTGMFTGATFTVTGLGGQFDSEAPYTEGYQIQPRGPQDVNVISAVEDLLPRSEISMFPNPASRMVNFSTEHTIESIAVFDLYGRRHLMEHSGSARLSIGSLAPGMYVIEVGTPEGKWVSLLARM